MIGRKRIKKAKQLGPGINHLYYPAWAWGNFVQKAGYCSQKAPLMHRSTSTAFKEKIISNLSH